MDVGSGEIFLTKKRKPLSGHTHDRVMGTRKCCRGARAQNEVRLLRRAEVGKGSFTIGSEQGEQGLHRSTCCQGSWWLVLELCNQTTFPHFLHPAPLDSDNHPSVSGSMSSFRLFLLISQSVKSYSICLSLSDIFTYNNAFKVHPSCCKWQDFLLLDSWIVFHGIHVPHCLYPFIC